MEIGQVVENFSAIDQHGEKVDLTDLLESGRVVLFFYPRASSPGWTRESSYFRDLASEFELLDSQPVGISADQFDRQKEFDEANNLGFTLLSDVKSKIAKYFGVKRIGPLGIKRQTFVIDVDRKILGVIVSETNMKIHADRALQILKTND